MNHLSTSEKMTSLARAFTTRGRKEDPHAASPWVGRAASQRTPNSKAVKRAEISLPVALLSTTNMLSYEAPDIINAPHVRQMGGRFFSSSSNASSAPSLIEDDSDQTGSVHSEETDATSVDLSSPEIGACEKGFFKSESPSRLTQSPKSNRDSHEKISRPSFEQHAPSPLIPTRAPSHSKRAHILSHKRSIQRMSSTSQTIRNSKDIFDLAAMPSVEHPFGRELQKLNEVAEEFGVSARTAEIEADMAAMQSRGLIRYCADDYLDEISSIYSATYEEEHRTQPSMVWI